jgi:hypothetical protein
MGGDLDWAALAHPVLGAMGLALSYGSGATVRDCYRAHRCPNCVALVVSRLGRCAAEPNRITRERGGLEGCCISTMTTGRRGGEAHPLNQPNIRLPHPSRARTGARDARPHGDLSGLPLAISQIAGWPSIPDVEPLQVHPISAPDTSMDRQRAASLGEVTFLLRSIIAAQPKCRRVSPALASAVDVGGSLRESGPHTSVKLQSEFGWRMLKCR